MSDPIFDPTLPADGSLIVAGELRAQLVSLDIEISNRALKPAAMSQLGLTVSNPPTQAEVQAIADKVDELIATLNS